MSFPWRTPQAARTRSSETARTTRPPSTCSTLASVPLKSKRCDSSFWACWSAFWISGQLTSETTSKDGMDSEIDGRVGVEPEQQSASRPDEERGPGDDDQAPRPHDLAPPRERLAEVVD